jgi:GR25 family glycosyltransferase involved in LPS biosynthesis
MSDLAFFAINLDRSKERWADIDYLFGPMPWPLVRISACDARDPESVLSERGQTIDHPPHGVGWNPYRYRMFTLVEEACFASHMKALKAFLASDHDYAIILEDDALPQDGFVEAMSLFLAARPPVDLVKLEGVKRRGRRLAVRVARLGNVDLVKSLRPSSGSAAYLVSRAGAAKLLNRAGTLRVPMDDYLSNPAFHGCDMVHLSPYLVVQARNGSTMKSLKTGYRHVKRRDPVHFLLQGTARGALRVKLWLAALGSLPLSLLNLRRARWETDNIRRLVERPSAADAAAGLQAIPHEV